VPITFRLCRDYLGAPYSLGSRESSIFDAYSLSVIARRTTELPLFVVRFHRGVRERPVSTAWNPRRA